MDFSTVDPIVWKGVERILIAIGAIIFGCLGYRLYMEGFARKKEKNAAHSLFLRFALSGTGPGLAFMVFGAFLLYMTLSSDEAPISPPGDVSTALDPIKNRLADHDRKIAGLANRLPEVVKQEIKLEVADVFREAEEDFLDQVQREITGHETNLQERVSQVLYDSLEESSRQSGIVNNILQDHEERIGSLESQMEGINPTQDQGIPR